MQPFKVVGFTRDTLEQHLLQVIKERSILELRAVPILPAPGPTPTGNAQTFRFRVVKLSTELFYATIELEEVGTGRWTTLRVFQDEITFLEPEPRT